jgi:ADP-ribose pyrophosphatase YjhB (NUDIX family)
VKTIIRIGEVIESPEAKLAKKFSSFGVRAFVEGYGNIRADHPEAVLFVEEDQNRIPVYITVGPNPPELLAGDRRVYAVFSPPDSQEPLATFVNEDLAREWAESTPEHNPEGFVIRPIDSTDRLGVQANVIVMVRRGPDLLFCRLKKSKLWTFPEARLEVSESTTWAARRAVKDTVGITIDEVKIPGLVPYVNTFVETAAQHFLSVVLVADTFEGEPRIMDPDGIFDACEWHPATDPPAPLFHTVQGIDRILSAQRPEDLADLTRPASSEKPIPKPKIGVLEPKASERVTSPNEVTIEDPAVGRKPLAAEDVQKHIDGLVAAMNRPPPVLITGTPRAGTVYATSVFRAAFAEHDTDVGHEEMGAIATVSWCHINPGLDRTYWNEAVGRYTGNYSQACPEWHAIAHQTRNPLKVIASMPTIPFHENGGWELAHGALRAHRERYDHLADQDPDWPDDLTSVEAYALFVLRWNKYIEAFTDFRYRVEDLHDGEGSVWPQLLEHLKLPQKPFPGGPFTSNAREHDDLTWNDLKRLAPSCYEPLRELATQYGY